MKNKIFAYLFYGTMIFLITSCSGVLDIAPDGRISEEDVFSDNDKVSAYLNTCYSHIADRGVTYFFWSRGPVEWSDEAWDTDAEAESWIKSGSWYNGNISAANNPIESWPNDNNNGNYWYMSWNGIMLCNKFLAKIDDATVTSPSDRSRWKAEAHLLRAYYYSELLRWYGMGLPIEKEAFDYTGDLSVIERSSYYDVVKFIIEDCDFALNNADLPWRITTGGEYGRFTKALAEGIKSRMILFAASPLYNDGKNYWEEAYTVNKTVLEELKEHGYTLYSSVNFPATYKSDNACLPNDYSALYNEYFTNSMAYSADPVDKETLYQTKGGQGTIFDVDGIGAQNGYKSGTCPSQELVDAFETIDGKPILDLEEPYLDEEHLQPNYNSNNTLYDPQNPYENRDPRFYADIYYNGSKRKCWWGFDEVAGCIENFPASKGDRLRIVATWNGEPKTGISKTTRFMTRTGYYQRKFQHPNSGANHAVAGANFKFLRLGEVYLNLAEAAAEANHLPEAEAAVNKIRERVGMPDLPVGLSQPEMILRVRHERRVELAMEENRFYDVRRWSLPDGDLSKTDKWITAMDITRNDDGTYTYNRRTVRSTPRACYTNKYLKLPISLDEANRTQSIFGTTWQNPGW